MANERKPLVVPGWRDPRWLILAYLFSFVVYALSSPGFSRRPAQWLAGLAVCLGLDWLLLRFYKKLNVLPVSGLVTSMGVLLLCDSPDVWPYALVAALSILSKHFVRSEGRHIFNPNNFGIVLGLLFFGEHVSVVAGRWGGSAAGMCLVAALGAFTAYRASRLDVSWTYAASFFAGVVVRSVWMRKPFLSVVAPMTGAAFQLFTFFMITDPMTTPSSRKGRIAFGTALGALDNVLRVYQVPHAPFHALFAVCAALPLLRSAAAAKAERVWVLRELSLPR
ncbi:MAG TPA: RnfABCDGE type electron transport complex subunit D [Elusimicrobiota bacterium]|nr:RnfABCDGE type electron transport complex subunit D [Elusimicrobiota bacterium]